MAFCELFTSKAKWQTYPVCVQDLSGMPGAELLTLQISEENAKTMNNEIKVSIFFIREYSCFFLIAKRIKCLYDNWNVKFFLHERSFYAFLLALLRARFLIILNFRL